MTRWYCSVCHTTSQSDEMPLVCENCGSDSRMIMDTAEIPETLEQVRDSARKKLKKICAVYPFCDGGDDRICQRQTYGSPIGIGGIGQGLSFRANCDALEGIRFNMSVVGDHFEPDAKCTFLGIPLAFPVLPSSTAGAGNYNDALDETAFCISVLRGAEEAGTIGLRGETWFYTLQNNPTLNAMAACSGYGIPVFKPRSQDSLKTLIEKAEALQCRAVGIDLDGCGSSLMKKHNQPVFKKSVKDIEELVTFTKLPFITKGIMQPEEAAKCADAGAAVIGVSNHGGRVLDATPGVAEVLPAIRERLGTGITITADGGVRTGYDVLKLLALGADAVLLGRDIIRAAVGAGTLGVRLHLAHIRDTLEKAMFMTGVERLSDRVDPGILYKHAG